MLVQHGMFGWAMSNAGDAVGCFFISSRPGVLGALAYPVCKMIGPLLQSASTAEARQASFSLLPDLPSSSVALAPGSLYDFSFSFFTTTALNNIGPINATPVHFDQDVVKRSLARMNRALVATDHQHVGHPA